MFRATAEVLEGDCLKVMKTLPDASVDAVITDPPYPCIKRDYGMWTENAWWKLMMGVSKEVRRVLKPTGSAVFILQPNSKKIGSMRGWLFHFQAWVCDQWNMVQDVWWWNHTALPTAVATHGKLLRASVKACVWAGPPDCYRMQEAVLWSESDRNKAHRLSGKCDRYTGPGGGSRVQKEERIAASAVKRGGTTPFNLLPIANANSSNSAGSHGHGAGTPMKLACWWVRYICPLGGTVLDPFLGSGTTVLAALKERRSAIGIEVVPEYVAIARKRIEKHQRNRGFIF